MECDWWIMCSFHTFFYLQTLDSWCQVKILLLQNLFFDLSLITLQFEFAWFKYAATLGPSSISFNAIQRLQSVI